MHIEFLSQESIMNLKAFIHLEQNLVAGIMEQMSMTTANMSVIRRR
ncbi:hypothetical protein [Campylobacter concisus]